MDKEDGNKVSKRIFYCIYIIKMISICKNTQKRHIYGVSMGFWYISNGKRIIGTETNFHKRLPECEFCTRFHP